jgi:hypothetical protein
MDRRPYYRGFRRSLLALLFLASHANGQTPNMGGGMVPNAPPLNVQGPITAGNCVKWVAQFTIGDAGAPCGSGGGTPCTAGGLDLSLTTGCNIPFYVGGVFP